MRHMRLSADVAPPRQEAPHVANTQAVVDSPGRMAPDPPRPSQTAVRFARIAVNYFMDPFKIDQGGDNRGTFPIPRAGRTALGRQEPAPRRTTNVGRPAAVSVAEADDPMLGTIPPGLDYGGMA